MARISTITDEAGFERISSGSREIAGLYFYLQLDHLAELAHHVARDFFARPQLYTDTGDKSVPPALARLRSRYGSHERLPDRAQRDGVFLPVFGQAADGNQQAGADFVRLRDDLAAAASAFAERAYDTGVAMLRERVRTSHRPLRDYLRGLRGDSLRWSVEEALSSLHREYAYPLLRAPGVCAVFGISTPPVSDWPFTEDSNADKLVEEICSRLSKEGGPRLTRESASNRQRVAVRGAEALATVVTFSEDSSDDDLDVLITCCYTWGAALRSVAVPERTATELSERPGFLG
ncbi:hypothetical protein [Streptomyces sp. NPDC050564]|uniref:hypothetical protein n=1 Tax=Streptomyces sp. NPDC050564 TaxID=3365631 RepID=UPI003798CC88